jgi:hypothetical protein
MKKATPTLILQALLAIGGSTALAATSGDGGATPPPGGDTTTPPPTNTPPPDTMPVDPAPTGTAFDSSGMWIWYVSQSSGGKLDSIAKRARKAGVTTVFVKSADGANMWSQFSKSLVRGLHKRGLKTCAWAYVYGKKPTSEARVARTAIQRGADCFVIDAEAEYEGRYAAADTYVRKLRSYAGKSYPIGVAPFPYVDYHPSFPYSVFLGPRGAQFSLPQMYWRAIGTSVKTVFQHTYAYSTLYAKPIYPLGQTYGGVSRKDLLRFRRYTQLYGARGLSWWSWQATTSNGWAALSQPLEAPAAGRRKTAATPTLARGSKGDFIVWAQEHLVAAGYKKQKLTGRFGSGTLHSVRSFQRANGLEVTGVLDQPTWAALLQRPPAKVRWRSSGGATAAAAGTYPEPSSARLPAKRYEIHAGKHRERR